MGLPSPVSMAINSKADGFVFEKFQFMEAWKRWWKGTPKPNVKPVGGLNVAMVNILRGIVMRANCGGFSFLPCSALASSSRISMGSSGRPPFSFYII